MNKFIVLAVFALAACQLVAANPIDDEEAFSQAAAGESSDAETGLLMGHEKLFSDYCREQRSYVIADMKRSARNAASDIFRQIFFNYNELADDLLHVEKEAVEQLAQQIETPDTPVSDEKMNENDIARLIDNGKREIAQKSDMTFGLLPAAKAVGQAMLSTVNSALFVRLAKARSFLSGSTLMEAININCQKVAEYEGHIKETMESTKSSIAQSNSQPDVQEFLNTVSVNSLHCQTVKNVVRLNAFCELFNSGRGPFLKMLGIAPKN